MIINTLNVKLLISNFQFQKSCKLAKQEQPNISMQVWKQMWNYDKKPKNLPIMSFPGKIDNSKVFIAKKKLQ